MDSTFKARWVAALTSGNYKQGFSVLHRITDTGDEFCCLGVACKLLADDGKIESAPHDWSVPSTARVMLYNGTDIHYMPVVARDKLGLPHYEMMRLADMNDDMKTFEEIAQWIDVNL